MEDQVLISASNQMSKIRLALYLREVLGWSWSQFVRYLYPDIKDKKELKRRVLSIRGGCINLKKKLKKKLGWKVIVLSGYSPPLLKQLIEERDHLIHLLSIVKDEKKKREAYRRLALVKAETLLYLLLMRFGMENRVEDVFGVFNRLKDSITWGKDHVKAYDKVLEWCSIELASLIIVSLLLADGPRPGVLRDVLQILSSGDERKKRRILNHVKRVFGDVITEYFLNQYLPPGSSA
ncbi:MAG: hypothetical protein QXM08_00345 [Thermofilaceae archaeon]